MKKVRGRKENLGKRIDELLSLKNKAKYESSRYTEMYVEDVVKEAQSTITKLQDKLNILQSSNKDTNEKEIIRVVDDIFNILTREHPSLIQVENDYTFWNDLNKKFND